MDKRALSERDICTKFITPALRQAGWDEQTQFLEEVPFTKGRITVRGKLVARGTAKRADYILHIKPNVPIGIIEAKDNRHAVGDGMQQALEYADILNLPFVFASNGDGFVLAPALLPLPPRGEQHRIVAKVDELMALCDQLEARLVLAEDTRRQLLDALLAEALSPVVPDPEAA